MAVSQCEVCRIPLNQAAREACPSPACPCYGTAAGSAEMATAARAWLDYAEAARAAGRSMAGSAAVAALELRAWLDYAEAAGDMLAVEIDHRVAP